MRTVWCGDSHAKRANNGKGDYGLSWCRLFIQCTYISLNSNSSTDEGGL